MGYTEYIKKTYKELFNFIKKDILKIFIVLFIIFIVIVVSAAIIIKTTPDAADALMQYITNIYAQKDLVNAEGNINAINLIWNNVMAGIVTTALGLFPYFIGPIFSLVLNSGIIGIVIGVTSLQGINIGIILLSILPHGIFEIPALILSMSLGFYLSLIIFKYIFKNKNIKFKKVFINVAKTFLLIIIPMLIIAGIIEAFVTPYIVKIFI